MGTRARELMPSGSSVKVAASQHPVVVYLAGLAEGPGRVAMRSTLKVVAAVLGNGTLESTPWHELRFQHVAALRSKLAESYAPASVNKALAAVRGVLKSCWRLGLVDTDSYTRSVDVGNVKGSRLPAGRLPWPS